MKPSSLSALALVTTLTGCGGDELGTSSTTGAGSGGAPSSASSTSSTSSASSTNSSGGSGGGGSMPCTATLVGGPAAAPYPFSLGGQSAWSHDDGYPAGYFHTYDALDVGGGAPHKVHVMLPRNYGPCDAGYPVVYMNDGGGVFWNNPFSGKSWRVPDALHDLYAVGAVPEVIVVAVEPNDRNAEYSHTEVAPDQTCCGADQYTEYVASHLKAFIDAHYRTATGRKDTMIVGSSRGGLAAFYLSTRRPEVFGKAICMSSSFWAGLDPVYGGTYPGGPLATSALITPVTGTLSDPAKRPRLWIDWGLVRTGGFHNAVIEASATERGKEMVSLLESTYGYAGGSELFHEEDPLGEHDEDSWARRFPEAMKALFGD